MYRGEPFPVTTSQPAPTTVPPTRQPEPVSERALTTMRPRIQPAQRIGTLYRPDGVTLRGRVIKTSRTTYTFTPFGSWTYDLEENSSAQNILTLDDEPNKKIRVSVNNSLSGGKRKTRKTKKMRKHKN
jgi:hypothetical protein